MKINNLINLENFKKNLSFNNYKSLDIGAYIYTQINRNPFLSLIKEEINTSIEANLSYDLEITINTYLGFNEKEGSIISELEIIKEQALIEGNQELISFLIKTIHTKKIQVLMYNSFYSEIRENYLTLENLEEFIKKSSKELPKQQAWNEWSSSSYKSYQKGILEQIKEKGIYIKSPFWHYDKAIEKVFDALNPKENSTFIILSSPSTYHQLLKKKILTYYKNEISQDSWDYKGKVYIPILSIPEIPNTILIIANPKDFRRWVKKPFYIEKNNEKNLITGRGSFSNELLKKDSSAYIELYLN